MQHFSLYESEREEPFPLILRMVDETDFGRLRIISLETCWRKKFSREWCGETVFGYAGIWQSFGQYKHDGSGVGSFCIVG